MSSVYKCLFLNGDVCFVFDAISVPMRFVDRISVSKDGQSQTNRFSALYHDGIRSRISMY